MKNDKILLAFMIINIIVFSFLMAFLTNKKEEKPKPTDNTHEVTDKKVKNCSLLIDSTNDKVTNSNDIVIRYSVDNIITDYSITYTLSYEGNNEPDTFKVYKRDYANLINKYQAVPNADIRDYSYVDNVYTFTIDYKLVPDDTNELILNYNQDINSALDILVNQGYVCK